MTELPTTIDKIDTTTDQEKAAFVADLQAKIEAAGYEVAEVDSSRPWGFFIRIADEQADEFIADFFPGLSPIDARLGNPEAKLSPKILGALPGQRLSSQTHERRAERWKFLTRGGYHKSMNVDDAGEMLVAEAGDEVQFAAGELHRLCGDKEGTTLVAEIWQHTNPDNPSNEDDIARYEDDYNRAA